MNILKYFASTYICFNVDIILNLLFFLLSPLLYACNIFKLLVGTSRFQFQLAIVSMIFGEVLQIILIVWKGVTQNKQIKLTLVCNLIEIFILVLLINILDTILHYLSFHKVGLCHSSHTCHFFHKYITSLCYLSCKSMAQVL